MGSIGADYSSTSERRTVKNFKAVTLVAAMLCASTAFAGGRIVDLRWDVYHVPGESLDSGLGNLPANYTGAEFMRNELKVVGEKLDSGLGQLSPQYTGAEFMSELQLVGESLDSGLGKLSKHYTGAEFMSELQIVGDSYDNGLGEMTSADVTIVMAMASLGN